MRSLGEVCFVALALVACRAKGSRDAEAAREEFAKTYSCPKEGVTATARPDLNAFDLMVARRDTPPSDVASDPGRLAEWERRGRQVEADYARQRVIQARGCDHEEYYACSLATGTTDVQVMACARARHPPRARADASGAP
jgi:hypothetical protein